MTTGTSQTQVVEALASGAVEGLSDEPPERVDTHAAIVFLTGARAFKMKRAVNYSFLDFSTVEKRREVLARELRLNRRTAPELYRRVLPIVRRSDGKLALGGEGQPVEWLLEMVRFDQAARLDRVAASVGLDDPLIDRLADQIAALHEGAEGRGDRGGYDGMRAVVEGNLDDIHALTPRVLDPRETRWLGPPSRRALDQCRELLECRRLHGRVRLCHGDLHLENIALVGGKPVLFDCLEFDDDLASVDILYDLAFLIMDLCHRRLRAEAQRLLSAYLELIPDDAGLALLPLFLSTRAVIRAKVHGLVAASRTRDTSAETHDAHTYLRHARAFLHPPAPRLVMLGGLSGCGKSSLARALAPDLPPAPGAVILRSDRLRKRLFGVAPTDRLPESAYGDDISEHVYGLMAKRARSLLKAGHSVVADAVFADPRERCHVADVARDLGVRSTGLWLQAPQQVLEQRIEARRGDASDATVDVLRRQIQRQIPMMDWTRIDALGSLEEVAGRAWAVLRRGAGSEPQVRRVRTSA